MDPQHGEATSIPGAAEGPFRKAMPVGNASRRTPDVRKGSCCFGIPSVVKSKGGGPLLGSGHKAGRRSYLMSFNKGSGAVAIFR